MNNNSQTNQPQQFQRRQWHWKNGNSLNSHQTKTKSQPQKTISANRHFVQLDQGTELEGIRGQLFSDRYSLKNEQGQPMEKYIEQTWHRISWGIAQVEPTPELRQQWETRFYQAMQDFKLVPSGRIHCSAGTGLDTTLINCFAIPNPIDTRKGILKTLEYVTEISARGGGVGFNLSSLRPRGSYLKTVNGTSSGAVSWGEIYSVAAHDIIQQGGTRRGALMIMLWDWHPDVEEFITIKKQQGKMLGANLSVCISDEFMEAVKKDQDWQLKFPDTNFHAYRSDWYGDLEEWEKMGYPVKIYKTIKARELWNLICQSAWESAEPGVVFMDQANKMNNTWYFEKNIATNPCAEQPLPAWGVCNLSSINLSAFVSAGTSTEGGEFDFETFKQTIRIGVRFLDNAIDAEHYLYKQIKKVQSKERRIGLGTMGLADALIKMKIRYGSPKSLQIIEKIYSIMRDIAYQTSIELAQERGSFPAFEADKYLQSGFVKTLPENIRQQIKQHGIRNALLLTQAPTGKIALLAGTSSGIEPVFSFSYLQKDRLGERTMYHPLYRKWIEKNKKVGTPETEIKTPDYFVVADDLTPEEHVQIQALIQKYTDAAISKTVNAPQTHTVEEVKKLYLLAHKTGCKGISYMREGSREGTLIRKHQEKDDQKLDTKSNGISEQPQVWIRPLKVDGATYKLDTPLGRAFVTVNHDENGSPVEVFINIGRAGSDVQAMAEALGRLISKSLKMSNRLSTKDRAMVIIDQLSGISSGRSVGFGSKKISSLPDAVAKALAMDMGLVGFSMENTSNAKTDKNIKQLSLTSDTINSKTISFTQTSTSPGLMRAGDLCPDCGNATLVSEMGCKTCHGCGYSEC